MQRLLVACMVLGFVALAVVGTVAVQAFRTARDHQRWLVHTYQVNGAITRTGQLLERTENTRRGYLLSPTPIARATHDAASAEVAPAIARVAALTRDNPRQRRALADLRSRTAAILAQEAATNALVDRGRADEARALYRRQAQARPFIPLRRVLARMNAEEVRLLGIRAEQVRAAVRRLTVASAAVIALVLLLAAVSLATVLRYTRDLSRKDAALRSLNDTLEDQVTERTAELARANEEIQRFAYIVSHDLRSPLVNVMGFTAELEAASKPLTELVRRAEAEAPAILSSDARLAAREDLPEAIGFIRTSTAKMDRLIGAILQLSRQGRRVLAPEPLDLEAMADGIVGSMQHRIEEAGAEVTVRRPLPALASDRVGVEQVLSNLVENALKYGQPGRAVRVTVSGHEARGRVHLAVEDNGRGIAPSDHARIFDLFRRSGAQDQPGEGIGLAHVRALVYRLGGTVDVRSELGRGATFLVNLPATLEPQ